ncbi:molybdopterin-dependent oxidoreductase [Escherichia coli]
MHWDEALNLFSQQHKRIREAYGPASIFAGSYGWRSNGVLHKASSVFTTLYGVKERLCRACRGIIGPARHRRGIMPYVVGGSEVYQQQTSSPLVLERSDVVVL